MGKKYVIGIDSGTSVVKAVLFDLEGNELYVSSRKTPVEEKFFGWSEYDMDIEWSEITNAIKNLLSETKINPEDVMSVGICAKCGGACFLNQDMKPVRLGVLWNDARCAEMTSEWIDNGKMQQLFEATGSWQMTSSIGFLLPWFKENEPEALEKSKVICAPDNWVCYKLTGELAANASDFFNSCDENRQISQKGLEISGISDMADKFPPLINPWEIGGYVTKEAEAQCGLKEGTPVVNMGWDAMCSTAGVGCVEAGQANIILGTSGVDIVVLPEKATSPMLGSQSIHNVPGHYAQMIAPLTGTPNSDWYVKNFTYEDKCRAEKENRSVYTLFDEEIQKVPAGCNGTIYHPYMNAAGERAPFTDTNARGNFFGLTQHSDRMVMLRAVYEGMAFSNKHCLDAYTYPVHDIRMSGGGTKSPVWCQIFADVCNANITLVNGTEYGAKGAAWNSLVATGYFKDHKEAANVFCKIDRVYKPIPENVAIYQDLYEVYKQIPAALKPAWEARSKFLSKHGFQG